MKELTPKQACEILGIHKNTLYRWVENGKLKARRVGPLEYRVFDAAEVKRIASHLSKERRRGFAVFPEKDLRGRKKKSR